MDSFETTNLEYLKSEMARIDLRIRREVLRWQRAGQDPGDNFRGLYVSDLQANQLLSKPLATSWGQNVAQNAEEDKAYLEASQKLAEQSRRILEKAQKLGVVPRLAHLVSEFHLQQVELDMLLLCLAPSLDLRYERLYGYLQDDITRKKPGVNLMLELLGDAGVSRFSLWQYLTEEGTLFFYHFLEKQKEQGQHSTLSQSLQVDNSLTGWLVGKYQPLSELASCLSLSASEAEESYLLSAGDSFRPLTVKNGDKQIIAFYGPDQASQEAAAHMEAAHLHKPLLFLHLSRVENDIPLKKVLRLALRDARLNGAIPFITGWDALLTEDRSLPPVILSELANFTGVVILSSKQVWKPIGLAEDLPLFWYAFELPSFARRKSLWKNFLPDKVVAEDVLDAVSGQFMLTCEQIRDACNTAVNLSRQRGGTLEREDIFSAARTYTNPNLANLARKIRPRYLWEDIILPEDQVKTLREIVDTVRWRPTVLEEWGVGKKLTSSSGVTVLFAGQPGTGKTMAAEIMAAELGLELYKIDLATVVSKYIGETEKNIENIFKEAERSNVILFFDEADALFGKRSEVKDAHDRYANIEISYLLQRMESYDGITILATNLKSNLDEAFTRRLQFVVTFPFPDEADRLRIWQALFPPGVPRTAEIDFAQLAQRFKLAGGNIRNIIVNAAYLAAADGKQVGMEHLFHSTFRELQKMGRLIKEEDMQNTEQ